MAKKLAEKPESSPATQEQQSEASTTGTSASDITSNESSAARQSAAPGGTNLPATQDAPNGNLTAASSGGAIGELDYDALMASGELDNINKANEENIEEGEIQIPRLSIAQPGTPEVASNEEGWIGGMLYENINREVVTTSGKPPWLLQKGIPAADLKTAPYLVFVPIFRLPTEYAKWPSKEERDAGQKIFHWKTLDKADPRVREGVWPPVGTFSGEGAPPVTSHLNILGMILNEQGEIVVPMIVVSFSRTSFKTGNKLVTACQIQNKMAGKLPFWGRVFYLFTEPKKNDNNQTYYILRFAKGRKLVEFTQNPDQGKQLFMQCYKLAKELAEAKDGIGRRRQERIINAAAFTEYDAPEGSGGGEAGDDDDVVTENPVF